MRRYIVILKDESSYYTDYPLSEWTKKIRCVVDQMTDRITFDGEWWDDIEIDHL